MHDPGTDPDTLLATLANGVRVLVLRMPQFASASVSVFVRSGSAHESPPLNGIGHFVEHMVFKGTRGRDARRINLDAERLGAEVDAHTDKDHTAFHLRGQQQHAPLFVRLLADVVQNPTFPATELESERQVLLHEFTEDEDDPMSGAYRLFDRACYGLHAVAQPVIGRRANIQRFTRDDLVGWVQRQYTGANLIVAAAVPGDPETIVDEAAAAFGDLPRGQPHVVQAPAWRGGVRSRRIAGSSQAHVVLGLCAPSLADDDPAAELAAALFGDGMSSPLMAELRERRGLVYYAACAADMLDSCGQFVVEASTAADQLDPVLREVARLLLAQAERIDPVDLERARNQVTVRRLLAAERPARLLEAAALEWFALGRVRSQAQRMAAHQSVSADQLRATFERMLASGVAAAISGRLARGAGELARASLAGLQAWLPPG